MWQFLALSRQWEEVPPVCVSLAIIARIKPKRRRQMSNGKPVSTKIDPKVFEGGRPPPWERGDNAGMTLKGNNHLIKIVGGIDWKGNPRG